MRKALILTVLSLFFASVETKAHKEDLNPCLMLKKAENAHEVCSKDRDCLLYTSDAADE